MEPRIVTNEIKALVMHVLADHLKISRIPWTAYLRRDAQLGQAAWLSVTVAIKPPFNAECSLRVEVISQPAGTSRFNEIARGFDRGSEPELASSNGLQNRLHDCVQYQLPFHNH